MIEKLEFLRSNDLQDEELKSLILEVRDETYREIANVFYTNEWKVNFYAGSETVSISWEQFLELFHRASLFVAEENRALLNDCEQGHP